MTVHLRPFACTVATFASLFMAACGGGGSNSGPTTYAVGGTVSGLNVGVSVVLQDNGGDNTTVAVNGSYVFPTQLADGARYAVTVLTQPSGQRCTVKNGAGSIAGSNVTIAVSCKTTNEWTWIGGSQTAGSSGNYGTQGIAAAGNFPGARLYSNTWTDSSGNLWLFGGVGYVPGLPDYLSDLWEYSAGQWTWIGGSQTANSSGTYGTQGTAAGGNFPGARQLSSTWTDSAGNFWLFGGGGFDSAGNVGLLNDLWEYSAGQWKWVDGLKTVGAIGVYGTQGVAASGNVPGPRQQASTWTDSSGNLWLFGGDGYDATGTNGKLSDLWVYSAGQWKWIGGPDTANANGIYGTQGIAAAGNLPGARFGASTWTDSSGNFWLFGGWGIDSAGNAGFLNDLWEYRAGQWTWVGGSNTGNVSGSYGTQGIAAATNVPPTRCCATSWTDLSGNFWLFGGSGNDFAAINQIGDFNDLWEYSAGQWTWVGGSNTFNARGVYGTQGTAAAGNVPGARSGISWTDSAGNFWLFGGGGYDSTGSSGSLNDLWSYTP